MKSVMNFPWLHEPDDRPLSPLARKSVGSPTTFPPAREPALEKHRAKEKPPSKTVRHRLINRISYTMLSILAIVAAAHKDEIMSASKGIVENAIAEKSLRDRDAARAKTGEPMLPDVQKTKQFDDEFVIDGHRHVIYAEVGERTRQWSATYYEGTRKRYFMCYRAHDLSVTEEILHNKDGVDQWENKSIGFSELPIDFQHLLLSNRLEPPEETDLAIRELILESLTAIREEIISSKDDRVLSKQ